MHRLQYLSEMRLGTAVRAQGRAEDAAAAEAMRNAEHG